MMTKGARLVAALGTDKEETGKEGGGGVVEGGEYNPSI